MAETITISENETTAEKPEETTSTERPEWLPEKFSSPEDMAKAYSELESKLGKPTETTANPKPDTGKSDPLAIDKAEQAVESAGLNMTDLQTEYDSNGKLEESSYEALAKAGITKDYVDAFIEGQQAIANQRASELKGLVGGDDKYSEIINWAKDNLTTAEIDAYNKSVNSGDMETTKLAVLGLQARHSGSEGIEPNLTRGQTTAGQTVGAFRSWAEVTTAMKDARYEKDPAYRTDIQNKIKNSQL